MNIFNDHYLLTIRGFLTFHKMTVFQFSEGISGLVGPERAGKDEFVYALQWALAEHPDLDKPSWAAEWTLWQVPFVILTARDSQGVEYRLQRKLTYGGKLEQSVNDHPMDADAFEQHLKVFRSDFHSHRPSHPMG